MLKKMSPLAWVFIAVVGWILFSSLNSNNTSGVTGDTWGYLNCDVRTGKVNKPLVVGDEAHGDRACAEFFGRHPDLLKH